MKLSELRPCDSCGGKLVPQFFVVEVKSMFFSPKAMNTTGGLITMFGGLNNPGALAIAETMSPDADVVKELPMATQLFICQKCYLFPKVDLAILVETRGRKLQEEEDKKDELGRGGVVVGQGDKAGSGGERPEENGVVEKGEAG